MASLRLSLTIVGEPFCNDSWVKSQRGLRVSAALLSVISLLTIVSLLSVIALLAIVALLTLVLGESAGDSCDNKSVE